MDFLISVATIAIFINLQIYLELGGFCYFNVCISK